ncbi:tripartite tricarboxylate transporter substrate binding protein [Kerstersia gyiorum]|uniref:ABC transporter substrate-binding protein n=1 Tax=Kerstersia gyiorum TaxID=206506 RepID=A0A171KRT5_9BURK|nr:tripartite tricarboxylate transporter substrate binding protein [Kerstersia gyiorum]KAB0542472.1 tripartite tricarboxylate transporter substrate binding protein [Kerstersia gyiorum]KKO71602.1 ABC transporter substrate-binding protein [Kerstersia gyiorum]MCP1634300.1 tripartite-type tricarboxylate transporter receptor subunit TctC [Kerstersia gyiorum]MCP1638073.1 tripartite-type tricarboxylate transporter receptor subunit TctC [Kerstersia gyiorum]MCP1672507.1 tripartite-type tricarboxylate t
MKQGIIRFAGAMVAAAMFAGAAQAAEYPTRSIELVVPTAAGGGTDAVARAFAEAIKPHLGQPMGVVNKPGGGTAIGTADVAKARPNGYKLGMVVVEMAILPSLGLAPFKTSDFTPIARINADPAAVTVRADAPWQTLEEFNEYVKQNPGKVRVGNAGTGSIWHLAAIAYEQKLGSKFNHVPYDGAAPAVTALLGDHIEAVTVSPAEVATHVSSGTLRTLGVMADERARGFEEVPTLKEKGIDLSIGTWRALVGPKGLPPAVVEKLRVAARQAAEEPAFIEVLERLDLGRVFDDADAFQASLVQEEATFKALIDELGLRR